MHILMAAVDALDIDADSLVLNRTSLQQMRDNNRHFQSIEQKSELLDKVISVKLSYYYFVYLLHSFV